jgi:uncharacterized membrane protein
MTATQAVRTPLDRLRWVSGILAILGLADAGYLSWIKLANAVAACSGIGDCASVNSSRYAEMWGIPVALFGVATYLVILALLVVEGRWTQNFYLFRLGVFGVTLVGTLYSAYLTYVEVAILRAICPYCVISAVLVTALFVLSIIRLRVEDESA